MCMCAPASVIIGVRCRELKVPTTANVQTFVDQSVSIVQNNTQWILHTCTVSIR